MFCENIWRETYIIAIAVRRVLKVFFPLDSVAKLQYDLYCLKGDVVIFTLIKQ
jgi:hypothetical protein